MCAEALGQGLLGALEIPRRGARVLEREIAPGLIGSQRDRALGVGLGLVNLTSRREDLGGMDLNRRILGGGRDGELGDSRGIAQPRSRPEELGEAQEALAAVVDRAPQIIDLGVEARHRPERLGMPARELVVQARFDQRLILLAELGERRRGDQMAGGEIAPEVHRAVGPDQCLRGHPVVQVAVGHRQGNDVARGMSGQHWSGGFHGLVAIEKWRELSEAIGFHSPVGRRVDEPPEREGESCDEQREQGQGGEMELGDPPPSPPPALLGEDDLVACLPANQDGQRNDRGERDAPELEREVSQVLNPQREETHPQAELERSERLAAPGANEREQQDHEQAGRDRDSQIDRQLDGLVLDVFGGLREREIASARGWESAPSDAGQREVADHAERLDEADELPGVSRLLQRRDLGHAFGDGLIAQVGSDREDGCDGNQGCRQPGPRVWRWPVDRRARRSALPPEADSKDDLAEEKGGDPPRETVRTTAAPMSR